jgi:hypothetical protein
MLLASSRQKPIHGGVNVSPKLSVARRKGPGFALIGLSGALEGYRVRFAVCRFQLAVGGWQLAISPIGPISPISPIRAAPRSCYTNHLLILWAAVRIEHGDAPRPGNC